MTDEETTDETCGQLIGVDGVSVNCIACQEWQSILSLSSCANRLPVP